MKQMLRLLKIEWNKIYNYKTARIFIIIYFALLASMGYLVTVIKPSVDNMSFDLAQLGAYIFPYVWQNITYFADFGSIFLGVIIITNITNEYSYRTIKQNLIDGLTKKEFLLSKLSVSLIFAVLSTVIVFFACLLLGLAYTQNPVSIFHGAEFILGYFLKISVFFLFCTLLAFWIRRSGFAFIVVILWRFVETIILGIEKIGSNSTFYISNLLPGNALAHLLPVPGIKIQNFMTGGSIFSLSDFQYQYCIAAIVYIVLFTVLSYRLLKKRDL
ncbi:MAG: ABC transporter permease [Prevotellaceae bacterium]|jgi:ABC-type transport system involved in multi-copper enzyme maturation permease subunit|nr:ABC transporter permease [Prevotellaceae bacterium]